MVLEERVRLLGLWSERLRFLQAQDALLLLHHSFTIPKVLHVLRFSPCFTSTHLSDFDDLRDFRNVTLEPGIGIRSAAQLAPSAYLASAAGCVNLVQPTLPSPSYKTLSTLA